jgi:hypothetical protein
MTSWKKFYITYILVYEIFEISFPSYCKLCLIIDSDIPPVLVHNPFKI